MECSQPETNTCNLSTFHYTERDIIFELKSSKIEDDETSSPFDSLLDTKWQDAMDKGLFRFPFDSTMPSKQLPGKFGFYLEANGQRHSTRRPPPTFSGTRQPLDPNRFHFGRAAAAERLFRLAGPEHPQSEDTADADDWLMINVSPIGRSHVLLVPQMSQLLPQRLEGRGLQLMLHCLLSSRDSGLRGLFNSLGALGSVNHYHLQMYRLSQRLYVETAPVRKIAEDLFEFTDYPARAFVFEVNRDNYATISSRVVALSELILDQGLAFNLVATRGWPCGEQSTQPGLYTTLRVLVWPRRPEFPLEVSRELFTLASSEMAGHFAVATLEAFDALTEEAIVEEFRAVTQPAFDQLRPLVTGDLLSAACRRLSTVCREEDTPTSAVCEEQDTPTSAVCVEQDTPTEYRGC